MAVKTTANGDQCCATGQWVSGKGLTTDRTGMRPTTDIWTACAKTKVLWLAFRLQVDRIALFDVIMLSPVIVVQKQSKVKVNRWIYMALYCKPFISKALRYGPCNKGIARMKHVTLEWWSPLQSAMIIYVSTMCNDWKRVGRMVLGRNWQQTRRPYLSSGIYLAARESDGANRMQHSSQGS